MSKNLSSFSRYVRILQDNKLTLSCFGTLFTLSGCAHSAPAATVPQRILLSPLEEGAAIEKGGVKMSALSVERADMGAKFGKDALTFRGVAEAAGGKGDFGIAGDVAGTTQTLGLWIHASAESNVASVGLQIKDGEDEYLIMQVPVDWTGWKKVEFDLSTVATTQTWPQDNKNKKIDAPLKSVNIVWFAKAAGPTSIAVDALYATTQLNEKSPLSVSGAWSGPTVGEFGQPMTGQLVLTNFSDAPQTSRISYSIQRDPAFYSPSPIDPIHGSDHALGAKNWTEEKGKRIDEGSLTDGKEWTAANAPWGQHTETVQTVDLAKARRISHLTLGASDGNWLWKVDVSASLDGKSYVPVPSLQGVDLHGKWGAQTLPVKAPFEARFLRLRHHKDGETVSSIAMPSSLSVYDGVADEKWDLPQVGEVVAQGNLSPSTPPRSFDAVSVSSDKPLAPGAYLVALKVQSGQSNQLIHGHYFVKPPALAEVNSSSRFGLNTALVELASQHRRLGIGWVRFENFKWRMVSPAEGVFRYDGTVAPWNVPHDEVVEGYTKEGISVLPFLFETPDYATSAPATVKQDRWAAYPPKDNKQYEEFAFQTTARYGSKQHAGADLKTPDKKSGLNKINVYELWNEPNLTDPGWGPFVGTTAQYLEMFRAGAEGVKRADPTAQVTNGGAGGIDLDIIDPYRTYRYADGKKPLDFVDILNVHYYSGRQAPEIATVDGNADRSGTATGARTFEEDLRRLVDWRNKNKPQMPIWMTETGYDSAGPFGTNEYIQAARLPRVVMMMLAGGMDKVFVYRETGSRPSMHSASGLMRNDGSYKPSWFTYATLIRQLDGTKDGKRLPYADENVRLYQWTRGAETIVAAWAVEGEANLSLNLGKSRVVDAFGAEKQVDIAGKLKLSTFPTYISKIPNLAPLQQLAKAASQAEAARVAENKRLAQTKVYLYDFGSEDKVGTIEIGEPRAFTAVLADNVYSDEKGYGFVAPAMSNEVAGWMNDPLERDAVRIGAGTQWKIKAEPGRYVLRLSASPLSPTPANAIIKGGKDGEKTFPVSQEKTAGETTLEVGDQPLLVSIDNYAMLRWVSLVKQ